MLDVNCFFHPKEEVKVSGSLSDQGRVECAKLWLEQSKLMWSRLQFVYFLHVSVLGGWYVLQARPLAIGGEWLQLGVLALGVIISVLFWRIMERDAEYMDEFKRSSGGMIPELKTSYWVSGRACAFGIILILVVAEIVLGLSVCARIIRYS